MTNRKHKNQKKSSAETTDEHLWTCVTGDIIFDGPLDRVMEYDSCVDHLGAECLNMSPTAYEYMPRTNGIWFCDPCTTKKKKIIKEVDTTTEKPKMKSDLSKPSVR